MKSRTYTYIILLCYLLLYIPVALSATFLIGGKIKFIVTDGQLYMTSTNSLVNSSTQLQSLAQAIGTNRWQIFSGNEPENFIIHFHQSFHLISGVQITIHSPEGHAYGPLSGQFGVQHFIEQLNSNNLLLNCFQGVPPINVFTESVIEGINNVITSGSISHSTYTIPHSLDSVGESLQITNTEQYSWEQSSDGNISLMLHNQEGTANEELASVSITPIYEDKQLMEHGFKFKNLKEKLNLITCCGCGKIFFSETSIGSSHGCQRW